MAFGDFTVVRSTTKRVLNSSGVLAEVAVNTPALEFNADGSYKGLLVEPAVTNLALRSEEFDNAYWSKFSVTITANYDTAPDNTATADRWVSAGGSFPQIARTITVVSGTVYTASLYVKSDGTSQIQQRVIIGGTGVNFTPTNNWQRVSVTFTASSASVAFVIATNSPTAPASSFVLWGAQLEASSVATSYIPTVASTVTRGADSVTLTGASSLIGQTDGTLYAEVDSRMFGVSRVFLENSSNPDQSGARRRIGVLSTNTVYVQIGSTVLNCGAGVAGINKVALVYSASGFAGFHNGVKYGPNVATPYVDVASRINIGSTSASANIINGHNRSVANFPTALSDAQAIALTT